MQSNQIINIHIVLSWATLDYFRYQVENFQHLAHDPKRIFFFVYALDYETHTYFSSCELVSLCFPIYKQNWAYRKKTFYDLKVWLQWMLTRQSKLRGSNGHASGLTGFQKTVGQLSGHHIIADVDTVVLQKNWDKKLLVLFDNFDVVGAPYEGIGGVTSGSKRLQTYKNLPSAVWVAFREGISLEKVSWWPAKEKNILIDNSVKQEIYGLPDGYEVVCDVGWKLCEFAYENNLFSKLFDHVKPSSQHVKALFNGSDYNEEYQLNGKPFIAHQRGSSQNPYRKTDMSISFFNDVEALTGIPARLSWPDKEIVKKGKLHKIVKSFI